MKPIKPKKLDDVIAKAGIDEESAAKLREANGTPVAKERTTGAPSRPTLDSRW